MIDGTKNHLIEEKESFEIENQAPIDHKAMDEALHHPDDTNVSLTAGETTFFPIVKDVNQEFTDQGYGPSIMLMIAMTLCWSLMHISIKYMFVQDPETTGFDVGSVQGYGLCLIFYPWAKYSGVNCSLLSFPPKVRLWLISRVLLGLLNNYALFTGIHLVSLGKGVMIWSLGPLFCFLVAGLCLGDMIRPLNVVLILASLAGVYLLTINKGDGEVTTALEYLGYFWLTASACFYGLLYMIFRKMTLYKVHPIISPLYLGIGAVLQTILLALFDHYCLNLRHW